MYKYSYILLFLLFQVFVGRDFDTIIGSYGLTGAHDDIASWAKENAPPFTTLPPALTIPYEVLVKGDLPREADPSKKVSHSLFPSLQFLSYCLFLSLSLLFSLFCILQTCPSFFFCTYLLSLLFLVGLLPFRCRI